MATPIGNLRDMTLRAFDTLKSADIIACEDTRVSGKLFQLLGIKKKLIPLHDHNEDAQSAFVLGEIAAGKSVALVSDAGMPLISDPGYKLVRACREAGVYVTSCPGANAPLMALQISGLPSDAFSFIGFLPSKSKARRDVLSTWKETPSTLIVFETAPRLEDSLADMLAVFGNRPLTLTRELTKKFEDVWMGDIVSALARVEKDGAPKGEIVLVIGRGDAKQSDDAVNSEELLRAAMERVSLREAVAEVVAMTGLPKKQIYALALSLRDSAPE